MLSRRCIGALLLLASLRHSSHALNSFSHPLSRADHAAGGRDRRGKSLLQRSASSTQVFGSIFEKLGRPKPVTFPRNRMNLDWAVLLMRSSYSVTDELDFIPMDQFQKEFFLFRQDEWQPYQTQHPGILQGDLSDPNYFDFISFAQYAVIADGMRNGKLVFEEKVGADSEVIIVRRDSSLADNEALPREHSLRVGRAILAKCLEKYGNSPAGPKVEAGQSTASLAENVDKLVGLFALNFYCSGYTTITTPGRNSEIRVSVRAPATLWSQQVLKNSGNFRLVNDFEAKAILAYLESCGLQATYTTAYRGLDIEHAFQF